MAILDLLVMFPHLAADYFYKNRPETKKGNYMCLALQLSLHLAMMKTDRNSAKESGGQIGSMMDKLHEVEGRTPLQSQVE